MKIKLQLAAFALLFTLNSQLTSVHAQGALTPPGAPAASMKTLAQIEPRTPISSAPFTISTGGSYYLTTNLTVSTGNAITISAGNVTLDLNGFTIAGTAATAAGYAIFLGGVTNVAIYNGHINSGVTNSAAGVFGGGGFGYGIYYSGTPPYNVRVKNVSIAGVLYHGIYLNLGYSSVVEACTVNGAGFYGICADSVADSTAMNCGLSGIVAGTAQNCIGSSLGAGYGLYATTANNCCGYNSGSGTGLDASIANNCLGYNSGSGNGLYAPDVATGCYGYSSGSYALDAGTANNCCGYNYSSGIGLYAYDVATGCYGYSNSGTGLSAFLASVCRGVTGTSGSSLSVTHNVNSY